MRHWDLQVPSISDCCDDVSACPSCHVRTLANAASHASRFHWPPLLSLHTCARTGRILGRHAAAPQPWKQVFEEGGNNVCPERLLRNTTSARTWRRPAVHGLGCCTQRPLGGSRGAATAGGSVARCKCVDPRPLRWSCVLRAAVGGARFDAFSFHQEAGTLTNKKNA